MCKLRRKKRLQKQVINLKNPKGYWGTISLKKEIRGKGLRKVLVQIAQPVQVLQTLLVQIVLPVQVQAHRALTQNQNLRAVQMPKKRKLGKLKWCEGLLAKRRNAEKK